MNEQTKAAVSVSEMARMVGLSRQRFHQLVGTTFPFPLYHVTTRRPFYPSDLQQICLDVRRRNCGIDGKPVLLYASGHRPKIQRSISRPKRPAREDRYVGLLEGLTALGLVATDKQIAEALAKLFPNGVEGREQGEVLKAVFLLLKRRDTGSNVGK